MNYLNIHTDTLRSAEYLGSEPVERATWLNLMAWCCTQENGGVIKGAADWGDRKWQQLCGVTKAEADMDSRLYGYTRSGSMTVKFYPSEKEREVRTNRLNGAKGGRPKKDKPNGNHPVSDRLNPKESERLEIAETERKGKEGNGIGKESSRQRVDDDSDSKTRKQGIPTLEQVMGYARDCPIMAKPEAATAFFDSMESNGWITRQGHPIADWRAAFRRYASVWNERDAANPTTKKKGGNPDGFGV